MNLHVTCTYNSIILIHCVLPPITSVHLVTSETPHNYNYIHAMHVVNILEFSLHSCWIKFRENGFAQKCLEKVAGYTMQHILAFIRRNFMEWTGTEWNSSVTLFPGTDPVSTVLL